MKTQLFKRESSAGLRSRLRILVLLASVLSLGAIGCTKAPEKPPTSPLMQAKKDERIDEEQRRELERRHLAPPPAYGNKVVMAKENVSKTERF